MSKQKKQRDEVPATPEEQAVYDRIWQAIPEGWKFLPSGYRSNRIVFENSETGAQFMVGYYSNRPNKWEFWSIFPKASDNWQPYSLGKFSVGFNPDKKPEAIIRDFKNRFLPVFLAEREKVVAQIAEHEEYLNSKASWKRKVKELMGVEPNHHSPDRFTLSAHGIDSIEVVGDGMIIKLNNYSMSGENGLKLLQWMKNNLPEKP